MLRFRSGHGSEGRIWPNLTEEITNLLHVYDPNVPRTNVTNCGSRATPPPDEKLTCFYDTQEIRQLCRAEDNYGYAEGSPCIFIQFNHVANFTPEVYTKQDLDNESLPQSLRSVFSLFIHFFTCLNSSFPNFSVPFSETLLPSLWWMIYEWCYQPFIIMMRSFLPGEKTQKTWTTISTISLHSSDGQVSFPDFFFTWDLPLKSSHSQHLKFSWNCDLSFSFSFFQSFPPVRLCTSFHIWWSTASNCFLCTLTHPRQECKWWRANIFPEREKKKPMTVSSSRCADCTFREWPLLNASSLSWSYYFLFPLFSFSFLLNFFWKWMSIWPSSIFFIPHLHLLSIPISLSLSPHLFIFLPSFCGWVYSRSISFLSLKIRHVSYFVDCFYLLFVVWCILQSQPWIHSLSLGSENSLLFQIRS